MTLLYQFNDPAEISAEHVQNELDRGGFVPTPIDQRPDRPVSAAGPIYLRPGDERCSVCDDPIGEFGGAPYVLVLARMKRDGPTDETTCADCHQPGKRVAADRGEQ